MAAEEQVAQARKIRLDSNRREGAMRRLRAAREVAKHHERLAAAEHNKVMTLIRTWELCPQDYWSEGFCCGNPDNCLGKQP